MKIKLAFASSMFPFVTLTEVIPLPRIPAYTVSARCLLLAMTLFLLPATASAQSAKAFEEQYPALQRLDHFENYTTSRDCRATKDGKSQSLIGTVFSGFRRSTD